MAISWAKPYVAAPGAALARKLIFLGDDQGELSKAKAQYSRVLNLVDIDLSCRWRAY